VDHGADAVLYWQWRSAPNGQEEYHGAIAGADAKPLPLYSEVTQLGREFERVSPALAGATPDCEVALLDTYDSRWAIDFQPHSREYDQQQVLLQFYAQLSRIAHSSGHQVDIVDSTMQGSLNRYKLLAAPSLNVISQPPRGQVTRLGSQRRPSSAWTAQRYEG
jgi:beta-galactosidase